MPSPLSIWEKLAQFGAPAGGFLGGPESVARFRQKLQADPFWEKYAAGLTDEQLAPTAFNSSNLYEPIDPSGQLAFDMPGNPRFVPGDEATRPWLERMAEAQRRGPEHAQHALRQWEQNYDPRTFGHISKNAFDEFDLGYASTGANAGATRKEKAIFAIDEPEIPPTYVDLDSPRNITNWNDRPNTKLLRVRDLDQFRRHDWGGDLYDRDRAWEELSKAKLEGAAGVYWTDILDPGPFAKPNPDLVAQYGVGGAWNQSPDEVFGHYPTGNVVGAFDPAYFRAPWAQFDPKRKWENNLLAGIGGLAAGGAALGAGTLAGTGEAEAGGLPSWLEKLHAGGRIVPYQPAGGAPYKWGDYLKAEKGLIGSPDENLIYPSGSVYWPGQPFKRSPQDRRLLQAAGDLGDPDDARVVAEEADRRARSTFDVIRSGGGDYAQEVLRKAGFTGVGQGSMLDPTGVTMLDPYHMRGGESALRQMWADQQNYTPYQVYHSGMMPFEQIDLGRASTGANKGVPMAFDKEKAFFTSSSPLQSSSYLERAAHQAPLTEAQQKMFGLPPDQANARWSEGYGEGANTMPLRLRGLEDYAVRDMEGRGYTRDDVWTGMREAREAGDPGIVFKNMRDEGYWPVEGYGKWRGSDEPADVQATFDTERVRSATAMFDPAKAHLKDLGAGVAGVAAGGAALGLGDGEAEAAGLPLDYKGGWLDLLSAVNPHAKAPYFRSVMDSPLGRDFGAFMEPQPGHNTWPHDPVALSGRMYQDISGPRNEPRSIGWNAQGGHTPYGLQPPTGILPRTQDERLIGAMTPQEKYDLFHDYDRDRIQRLGQPSSRSYWDFLKTEHPNYTKDLLGRAGFTGVSHGGDFGTVPFNPPGVTMLDPRHVRSGDEAVWAAQADVQNYTPFQLYHATDKAFDQFDLNYASTGMNAGLGPDKERAIFGVPKPPVAASYLRETADFDLPTGQWINQYAPGASMYPYRLRGVEDYSTLDMRGAGYRRRDVWPALAEASARGDPGVIFRNMRDSGGYGSDPTAHDPADIYATFDLSRMRSPWARFDPAKQHLKDLGAGFAGAAALGGAATGLGMGGEAEAATGPPTTTPAPPAWPPAEALAGRSAPPARDWAEQQAAAYKRPQPLPAGVESFGGGEPAPIGAKGDRQPLPQIPDPTLTGSWPESGAGDAAFPDRSTWMGRMADAWQGRDGLDATADPAADAAFQRSLEAMDPEALKARYEKQSGYYGPPGAAWSLAGQPLVDAAEVFGRGIKGEATADETQRAAMDVAMSLGGTGFGRSALASRLPPGEQELGAFGTRRMAMMGGGPKPGQMGEDAMRAAEQRLFAAGRDPEALERIRQETGYFFTPGRRPEMKGGFLTGMEGPNTMYEMSDAGTDLNFPSGFGPGLGQRSNWSGQLSDIAEFPELFRQLPNLRTLPVELHAGPSGTGAGGQYRYPRTGTPRDDDTGGRLGSVAIWNAEENDMTLRKLAHEGPGHAVDYHGGNPKGGNATDPGYFFKGGEVSANDLALYRLGMDDIDKFHDWPHLARAYAEGRKVDEPLPWLYRPPGIGPQGQVERMWKKPVDWATIDARRALANRSGQMPWGKELLGPENEANRAKRSALYKLIDEGKPLPWEKGGSPLDDMTAETWMTKGGKVMPGEKPGSKRPPWLQRPLPDLTREQWEQVLRDMDPDKRASILFRKGL